MSRFSKRRKFAANWTEDSQGIKHPSKGQAEWFDRLRMRERAGEIRIVEREPGFDIRVARDCPHCKVHGEKVGVVKFDAKIEHVETGEIEFLDYKGVEGETPLSKLKAKLVRAIFGVEVVIVGPAAQRKQKEADKKRWLRERHNKVLGEGAEPKER